MSDAGPGDWTFGEGNVGKFQTFSEYRRDAYGTLGLGSASLSGVALSWRQSIIGSLPNDLSDVALAKSEALAKLGPACARGRDRAAGTFTVEHQRQNLGHAYLIC